MDDIAYQEMVTDNLKKDSPDEFGNFTKTHANFIIKSFIESAQEHIEIFSGSFNDAFYDGLEMFNLLERAAKRIDKPEAIRIITLEQKSEKLMAFVDQVNKKLGKLVIVYISTIYKGINKLQHFLLVDGKRYRIEESHEPLGDTMPEKTKAVVCCNRPETVSKWLTYFDGFWDLLRSQLPANG